MAEKNIDSESRIILDALNTVMRGESYDESLTTAFSLVENESTYIRGCGVECLGHIARIHGKLEMEEATAILRKALQDSSSFVRGKAESSISDICHFLKVERKIFLERKKHSK